MRHSPDLPDRVAGDVFGDEKGAGRAGRGAGGDLENLADDAAGEGPGLEVVVGDGWDDVVEPAVVAEGNDGQVVGDLEAAFGEPGEGGEDLAGTGGDEGGWWILEFESTFEKFGETSGFAAIDEAVDGPGASVGDGFEKALFGGAEAGEWNVGHHEADGGVAVALEESAGVEGGGPPVLVDAWEGDSGLRMAADQGGDLLLFEPGLDEGRTLVENPGVGALVAEELLELAGRVGEMKEAGGEQIEFVSLFVEEVAEGVELQEHFRGHLLEAFRGEEGDALGAGPVKWCGRAAGLEDLSALAVFAGGDPLAGFEDIEGGSQGVAADLKIGGESAFAGKEAAEFSVHDHFLQNISRLGR